MISLNRPASHLLFIPSPAQGLSIEAKTLNFASPSFDLYHLCYMSRTSAIRLVPRPSPASRSFCSSTASTSSSPSSKPDASMPQHKITILYISSVWPEVCLRGPPLHLPSYPRSPSPQRPVFGPTPCYEPSLIQVDPPQFTSALPLRSTRPLRSSLRDFQLRPTRYSSID